MPAGLAAPLEIVVLPDREVDPARRDQRLARVPATFTQFSHPPEEKADDLVLAQRLELLLPPRGLGRSRVCARRGELHRCRSHGWRYRLGAVATVERLRSMEGRAVRALERTADGEIRNVRHAVLAARPPASSVRRGGPMRRSLGPPRFFARSRP